MSSQRDFDKVLKSFARWVAGLEPSYGRIHYFEKLKKAKQLKEAIDKSSGVCPFCKKVFKRKSGLVWHVIRQHRREIEEILGLPPLPFSTNENSK